MGMGMGVCLRPVLTAPKAPSPNALVGPHPPALGLRAFLEDSCPASAELSILQVGWLCAADQRFQSAGYYTSLFAFSRHSPEAPKVSSVRSSVISLAHGQNHMVPVKQAYPSQREGTLFSSSDTTETAAWCQLRLQTEGRTEEYEQTPSDMQTATELLLHYYYTLHYYTSEVGCGGR